MSASLATVSYLWSNHPFPTLRLGGLSNQETSRRGNLYGKDRHGHAVVATVFGPRVARCIPYGSVGAMVVGGSIGLYAACRTNDANARTGRTDAQSGRRLAACLVGFASYIDT